MESVFWRADNLMQLVGYFQGHGGNRRLEWRIWFEGSEHSRVWHAITYVDGIAFGEGSGPTKAQARETAARTTLAALALETQSTTQNTTRTEGTL